MDDGLEAALARIMQRKNNQNQEEKDVVQQSKLGMEDNKSRSNRLKAEWHSVIQSLDTEINLFDDRLSALGLDLGIQYLSASMGASNSKSFSLVGQGAASLSVRVFVTVNQHISGAIQTTFRHPNGVHGLGYFVVNFVNFEPRRIISNLMTLCSE